MKPNLCDYLANTSLRWAELERMIREEEIPLEPLTADERLDQPNARTTEANLGAWRTIAARAVLTISRAKKDHARDVCLRALDALEEANIPLEDLERLAQKIRLAYVRTHLNEK